MATFSRKLSRAIGTGATVVGTYTVPSGKYAIVIGLSLANVTTNTVKGTVQLDDGTNQTNIVKAADIPPGDALLAISEGQKVILNVGDSIKVTSDTASSIDVILSILEDNV